MRYEAHIQMVPDRELWVRKVTIPALERAGVKYTLWVDDGRRGPLWNALRIWRHAAEGDTAALVIQDDTIPHREMFLHIPDIVAHLERDDAKAVSMWARPKRSSIKADAKGHNFVACKYFTSAPGTIHRPDVLREAVAFHDRYGPSPRNPRSDDTFMGDFLTTKGYIVHTTIPSLVQHDINTPSIVGNKAKTRGYMGAATSRRSPVWWATIPPDWFKTINAMPQPSSEYFDYAPDFFQKWGVE